jgi:hypothetical protein
MISMDYGSVCRWLLSALGLLALVAGGGCAGEHRLVHDPPLAQNVSKIVRGTTTREQVLEYFGVPDYEVRGNVVTLRDDSMLGQHYREIRERMEQAYQHAARNGQPQMANGATMMDQAANRGAYSSIDDAHIAYLYEETETLYSAWALPFPDIMVVRSNVRTHQNRLLLLINKHTGLVDEFGFRREF